MVIVSNSCQPKIAGNRFSIHGKYISSCVWGVRQVSTSMCPCLFVIENRKKVSKKTQTIGILSSSCPLLQTQHRSPQVTSGAKHCNENKPLFCSAKFCWSSHSSTSCAIKYAMHQTIKEHYKQADTCRCCPRYQGFSLEHDTKGGTAEKEGPGGSWCEVAGYRRLANIRVKFS